MRAAAQRFGISYTCLGEWYRRYPEFTAALNQAREDGAEAYAHKAEEALEEVRGASRDQGAAVTAAGQLAHHFRWCASVLKPKTYATKVAFDKDNPLVIEDRSSLRDKILEATPQEQIEGPVVH